MMLQYTKLILLHYACKITIAKVNTGITALSYGTDGANESEASSKPTVNQDTVKRAAKAPLNELNLSTPGDSVPQKRLAQTRKALLRLFF